MSQTCARSQEYGTLFDHIGMLQDDERMTAYHDAIRLNAARQTRLSDLVSLTPDKDDSLEARQRRLFQIDVKSRPRSAPPKKDYAIYGPALLDVSDHRTGGSSPQAPTLPREHALEYPLRVDLPPPDPRISVI